MSDVLTLVLFVSVTDDGLAIGDDGCFVYDTHRTLLILSISTAVGRVLGQGLKDGGLECSEGFKGQHKRGKQITGIVVLIVMSRSWEKQGTAGEVKS